MTAALKLHVIATGSKGNAAVVENVATGRGVLVDCGVSKKALFAGCATVGFDVRALEAIFVTHEHADHTRGLGVVMRGLARAGAAPALYIDGRVLDASREAREAAEFADVRPLEAGAGIVVAGIRAHPFRTAHDAAFSCGFRFEANDDAIGYLTDTGVLTGEAAEALAGVRVLALESNHDARMLATCLYPERVKRRIASDVGHLSNEQAACALDGLLSEELEEVVAMHVSENSNTYAESCRLLAQVVERAGLDVRVRAGFQRSCVSAG